MRHHTRFGPFVFGVFFVIGLVADLCPATAQTVGPEFRVNTFTDGDQAHPAVAMNANGEFVVAWESANQDGSGLGIYVQRFDPNGNKMGSELRANTHTALDQSFAAVALRDDGSFLVAWQSTDQDGHGRGVFARLFDSAGGPIGSEFQVNTTTYSNQAFPHVTINPNTDGFVITWSSAFQDGSSDAVIVRRYDADANPLGGEIVANIHTYGFQGYSRVECDAVGDFVIVHTSWELDGDQYAVAGRRYRENGAPLGGEFLVNVFTTSHQDYPDVAVARDDGFVVVWHSALQDGSGYGVYGRRYDDGGSPVTGEFQVNAHTASSQSWAKVAMDHFGSFTIVWQSDSQDGSGRGVYGRRFRHDGTPHTSEFRVNTQTAGSQERPAIASDPIGNLVVVWHSTNQDGSGLGIYGQRIAAGTVPVAFSSITAQEEDGVAHLRWGVVSEVHVLGFNVYRNTDGRELPIAKMLPSDVTEFVDPSVEPGDSYVYTVGVVDAAGNETLSRGAALVIPPVDIRLLQNHPNPFNPLTKIGYSTDKVGPVDLRVYDSLGRVVVTLESGIKPAGNHVALWDGRDTSGVMASSGVYFYRLETNGRTLTKKMILLK